VWRARLIPSAGAVLAALAGLAGAVAGCGDGAGTILVPDAYIVAGRVVDPTTSPIAGLPGATVLVETASIVQAVTSDSEGNFILQGVPPGLHRLRATLPGRVPTISADLLVGANIADGFLPLFTDAQIDSVLAARGAPAWNRTKGLLGLFALRSNGVPLGDAVLAVSPPPGGSLVQTGEGKDPIVIVNGEPGTYGANVTRPGYAWDPSYGVTLRPAELTFAAPRARPNFNGFVFAHSPEGPPLPGVEVVTVRGSSASATTNFLGQFSLVGLATGTHVARFAPDAFRPTLSMPVPIEEDTTLALVAVAGDSLAAWSVAAGGPVPDSTFGAILLDVRDEETGATIDGARVEIVGGGGVSLPQGPRSRALRVNVPAGDYRVLASAPGHATSPVVEEVQVREGHVTFGRIDLGPPVAASRTSRQRR
jgi:hypothetical protein